MENNRICNWLLFYTTENTENFKTENLNDIHSSVNIKIKMCSSISYFECGAVLLDNFPEKSSGFFGIFNYLSNHKGYVMEKLKDDEQESYINKLKDFDNFSMQHHVSMIKCLMKIYVCQLAPWERIKRALDAIGVASKTDSNTKLNTFRHVQQGLILWLKQVACKGLQRITTCNKSNSESNVQSIINYSSLGSLALYVMMYYTRTKMLKYNVKLPDVNSPNKDYVASFELALHHSGIVMKAFSDLCDNKDILPLQIDYLVTKAVDSVPATLTIALVFHWTFGNSLKNLENLLKSSVYSPDTNNRDNTFNHRPSNLSLNSNSKDLLEPSTGFFMNNNRTSTENLRQKFTKIKEDKNKNLLNGSNKVVVDGETSPEIFLTPTEDEMPASFTNSVTPPIKLLAYKTVDKVPKSISSMTSQEPVSFSLKDEFQKKIAQKQILVKQKPKVSIIANNETTWLAQSNKNNVTHIPLTPKKTVKPTDVIYPNDSSRSLTKSQMNQLQMQLSIRRKKIENDKKEVVQKTEKSLEDSKQKVFFQAINQKSGVLVRRKSLELFKDQSQVDIEADKRLSMYMTRIKTNVDSSAIRRIFQRESPLKEKPDSTESSIVVTPPSLGLNRNQENFFIELGSPQLPQNSESVLSQIEICPDQRSSVSLEKNDTKQKSIAQLLSSVPKENNESKQESISELLINVPPNETVPKGTSEYKSPSRKNSSPSLSSLSSLSNTSSDKNLVTKDEYQKSFDLLSSSLMSLQEEIRVLSQRQPPWNRQISQPIVKVQTIIETPKAKSENNSVAETPTNNAFSLTEITDLPKEVIKIPSLLNNIEEGRQISSIEEVKQTLIEEDSLPSTLLSQKNNKELPHVVEIEASQIVLSCPRTPTITNNLKETSPIHQNEPEDRSDSESLLTVSITESPTDDCVTEINSSVESLVASTVQPVAFIIADDQKNLDALKRKAELLEKREQRRLIKLDALRQKREQDRENRLSATNEDLIERELKKRLEQEKRDSLLQKYLDRKNEERTPSLPLSERRSSSTANTPKKSSNKFKNPRSNIGSVTQESVESLALGSLKRNNWFSSMRQTHRVTSSSTSILNTNTGLHDSAKFGVPLPPQEYMGPKLFGKRKVKTNRSVIANAIAHCCLAGSVNILVKEAVLKDLSEAEGTHFMILFRDSRCQYRSLYLFDLTTEDLNLITGSGPKKITHEMVEKFFKYNSGAKQFNPILSTKHLSPAVDAICIQSIHWNSRPSGQVLTGAVSSLSLPRSRKLP